MLFRNMFLKYYAAADENGDGGAPSGGEPEITPEIQQIIDARVNSVVTGLKTKNSELLGTIKQQKITSRVLTVSIRTPLKPFCSAFPTTKRQS